VDTSLYCDLTPKTPTYITKPNFACFSDPFDSTASMMVNCSASIGSSAWTFRRFLNSTTCTNATTVLTKSDSGSGCLTLGNVGFRVDCTGQVASTGAMCRQTDLDSCKQYTTQTACRSQGFDVPCDWCVADQRCYYRPPLQPCYQELFDTMTTTQYLPSGGCTVGSVCNISDSLKCLAKTPLSNCGVSTKLSCQPCVNPSAPSTQICTLNPPKLCNYLGVGSTFPNYCPGYVPAYPPCDDNQMHEATAWCSQKESAEECNYSDDNVYPCMWCSPFGGAPRCMWTPPISCSYFEPTYALTVIYGGVSVDHSGGQCPVIGGASIALVSGWSIILVLLSLVL